MIIQAPSVVTDSVVWSPGWVQIEGRHVVRSGRGIVPRPLQGEASVRVQGTIVPGFVDIHTHGANGISYSEAANGVPIESALDWQLKHGVTTTIASLASASMEDLTAQMAALDKYCAAGLIRGVHLEGPWLSPRNRGAHSAKLLRAPAAADVASLLAASRNIRMVTIAPELKGALPAIRAIVRAGAVAAIGHTSSDEATARAAIDAGATVATHIFNGMPQLHHRQMGPVGAALLDPRVFLELILDGHHLSQSAVDLVLGIAKARAMAVSDSIAATGVADGDYSLAGSEIRVRDGTARAVDTDSLAGSTKSLDSAFRRLITENNFTLSEAVGATSTRAAQALGLRDVGHFATGALADLIVLDGSLDVVAVLHQGVWVEGLPLVVSVQN
ncbi:amidohydrolase family protein [Salinibacterium sp.]|uniref:N-acetylglucosamine-6-phosphate deacetylase n=1 Tax=Salinibacterium sp. TaxID=1915057 RepID=UPI00286A7B01|nr:amidohydrolase family protein [Salinibacterium sp.]